MWGVVAVCIFAQMTRRTAAMRLQLTDTGPNISRALDCLRLSEPALELEYPSDAEEHVDEIRRALPWRWPNDTLRYSYSIEDMWMTEVMGRWDNRSNGTRLSDMFGPYISIFAYFVGPWWKNHFRYPRGMIPALQKVLRRKVPYIVVSQNDEGLAGFRGGEFNMTQHPNILVLSAGGYGNVAVPLFPSNGRDLQAAKRSTVHFLREHPIRRNPSTRPSFVSFVGTIGHAPWKLRERVQETVRNYSLAHGISNETVFYRGPKWTAVAADSKFSLAPRGYGRTTYHLIELIHMGLIPIHVYSDVPWVPYPELFSKMGFVTNHTGVPALLDQLRSMSPSEIEAREAFVAKAATTHFTPEAVVDQIFDFMLWRRGGGDLRCQRRPPTVRDGDYPSELHPPVKKAANKANTLQGRFRAKESTMNSRPQRP